MSTMPERVCRCEEFDLMRKDRDMFQQRAFDAERERDAIEVIMRQDAACPLVNNEGIEPEEGRYFCFGEDGDPIIHADTLPEAVEGMLDCWGRLSEIYKKKCDEATALRADLKALAERTYDALIWCSGSADFAPGGQAHIGWKRGPAVVITRCRAILDREGT